MTRRDMAHRHQRSPPVGHAPPPGPADPRAVRPRKHPASEMSAAASGPSGGPHQLRHPSQHLRASACQGSMACHQIGAVQRRKGRRE